MVLSLIITKKILVKGKSLSCVQLLATSWTAAYQAPPSMGFSRQEYLIGLPLPSPKKKKKKRYQKLNTVNHIKLLLPQNQKTKEIFTAKLYKISQNCLHHSSIILSQHSDSEKLIALWHLYFILFFKKILFLNFTTLYQFCQIS